MTAPARADAFCARFGLQLPVLLAPMASTCLPAMSAAIANAGGMGQRDGDPDRMQLWAGQRAAMAKGVPVNLVPQEIWTTAQGLLP